MRNGIFHLLSATTLAVALSASSAYAQKKYDTGATDTEIKIGQTVPFSGPASAYSSIGKAQAAYFKMINEQGGINGRMIKYITYDDAYSPPTWQAWGCVRGIADQLNIALPHESPDACQADKC